MGGMGAPPLSLNEYIMRPLLEGILTVVLLFLIPLITMRLYAEEKRSGTIELLLTSPLTDIQIILGKFLGALGLYAVLILLDLALRRIVVCVTAIPMPSRCWRGFWDCCFTARAVGSGNVDFDFHQKPDYRRQRGHGRISSALCPGLEFVLFEQRRGTRSFVHRSDYTLR